MGKVQCNRAGAFDRCDECDHAEPHEREEFGCRWMGGPEFCTEWRECFRDDPAHKAKVRCVRVTS